MKSRSIRLEAATLAIRDDDSVSSINRKRNRRYEKPAPAVNGGPLSRESFGALAGTLLAGIRGRMPTPDSGKYPANPGTATKCLSEIGSWVGTGQHADGSIRRCKMKVLRKSAFRAVFAARLGTPRLWRLD